MDEIQPFCGRIGPLSMVGTIYLRLRAKGGSQQPQVPFWSWRSKTI
jgi:hypothetical protein